MRSPLFHRIASLPWVLLLAFGAIYIIWGSTYLANWYAIQDIPPFLMSGTRFIAAGGILVGVSMLRGQRLPTVAQLKNSIYTGFMLLAMGTGLLVWSEQFISTGMVALMTALQPLLVVLLMWGMQGVRPGTATLFGTLLGIIGMALLVGQDEFLSDGNSLIGLLAIFVAVLSWGYASIVVAGLDMPSSRLQSAGFQMLAGGLILAIFSVVSGEAAHFEWGALSSRGVWSWIYLVLFGSIIAFSAFNYLLVKSTPDKVATANYVNPVVAMLLGWSLNDEHISAQSLLAAAVMLTGVVFINARKKTQRSRMGRPHPLASLVADAGDYTTDIHILPPADEPVIARIWQGVAHQGQEAAYLDFAKRTLVPAFKGVPGNMGITLAHRREGEHTRFYFISYWKDFQAIERFVGTNYSRAIVYPQEREMLVEIPPTVEHRCIKV